MRARLPRPRKCHVAVTAVLVAVALVAMAACAQGATASASASPKAKAPASMPVAAQEKIAEHQRRAHRMYRDLQRAAKAAAPAPAPPTPGGSSGGGGGGGDTQQRARKLAHNNYVCDPAVCVAPDCKCADTVNPGGFEPSNTPQFVSGVCCGRGGVWYFDGLLMGRGLTA